MKKSFLILCLLAYFAGTTLSAQETTPRNVVKVDLFSPLFPAFFGYYERVLSEDTSVQFGLLAASNFIMVTGAYRFYLSEVPAPSGIFVSPLAGIGSESGFAAGLGLLVGGQKILRHNISIEGSIGPTYIHIGERGYFVPFGGITIGLAF